MSNVTQENGQDRTDTPQVRPDEGHAAIISRRPAWADKTELQVDNSIFHSWTAPTVAKVLEPGMDTLVSATVEIHRFDDLLAHDDVVALHRGTWRIFVLDTAIEDTVNARRLAAAIIECCDQIEQAGAEDEEDEL